MEEFDLLGHLHDGESSNNLPAQDGESVQVLLWKKLDINGYVPASREVSKDSLLIALFWDSK